MANQMHDVDTGHDYDGIREFDNPLPRWWLITLWGSVVFAVFYWAYYHTTDLGPDQLGELQAEINEADAAEKARMAEMIKSGKSPNSEKALVAMSKDAAAIEAGKAVFTANCASCHAQKAEGLVGPNLTDKYWIHGGKAENIFKVVAEGVLPKGMPAWKASIGESKVREVTAYILSVRNTNVPGKAPQGVDADGKKPPAK